MENQNNKLKNWETYISIAIVAYIIKYFVGGAIGDAFAIIGVVFLIIAFIKYKKSKSNK